jgi:hypothetical protein
MFVISRTFFNQILRFEEPDLEVKLSDELTGSLREMRVCVNIYVNLDPTLTLSLPEGYCFIGHLFARGFSKKLLYY